jgi:hypothetical protein
VVGNEKRDEEEGESVCSLPRTMVRRKEKDVVIVDSVCEKSCYETPGAEIKLEPCRQHEKLQRLVTPAAYSLRSTFVGGQNERIEKWVLTRGLRRQA